MSKSSEVGDRLETALAHLKEQPSDEASWRLLYERLWPFVVGVTYRILGGMAEDARDAAQEAFLRLIRHGSMKDFSNLATLRAYLRVTATNTARDRLRRLYRQRHTAAEPADEVAESATPAETLEADETLARLLVVLSESDRTIVRYLAAGYSIKEIAERLGISYGAARVRLTRLRKRLTAVRP